MKKIITLIVISTLSLVSGNIKVKIKHSKKVVASKSIQVCILPYKKRYRGVKCSNKLIKCNKDRSCLLILKNKTLKGHVKRITKKQAISGPKFKNGISAFITAKF